MCEKYDDDELAMSALKTDMPLVMRVAGGETTIRDALEVQSLYTLVDLLKMGVLIFVAMLFVLLVVGSIRGAW